MRVKSTYVKASLLVLLLCAGNGAAANNAADLRPFVGKWNTAAISQKPGGQTVVTRATAARLSLVLPDDLKLPSGQTVPSLDRVDETRFSATDKAGVIVQFTLKSPGHAELTIKSQNSGLLSYRQKYFDTDLTLN